MDDLPGFNVGGWYDFGGTWNDARKRCDLFGDSISDIDYSCNPVLRVGGAANIVPMDRKSEYDIDELSRIRTSTAAPGGTSLISLLGGGGLGAIGTTGASAYSLDAVDSYTFEAYWAAKWHGFSIYNGYWARDLNNFRGVRQSTGNGTSAYPGNGLDNSILYTVNTSPTATTAALFPSNKALIDLGAQLQGGYFVLPKKLELVARVSVITGDSGDVYGDGLATATKTTITDAAGAHTVLVIPGAFSHNHTSEEYAAGVNWYFYRQLVKWQTDVSYYNGGNPAAGGQSPAGFIPGVDGWMLRTQIQLAF